MKPNDQIRQAKLMHWAALIKDQQDSSLTVREWCTLNNHSYHAYNYWKHILKESYVESVVPDIVPVSLPPQITTQNISSDSCKIHSDVITIDTAYAKIELSSSISDERLLAIIKAVRYA